MKDNRKARNTDPPEAVLELTKAYNKIDRLRGKDSNISPTLDAALDELDATIKALLHREMLKTKAYSKDDYDTLPDAIWKGFASAHLNRYWRLGAQPK